MGADAAEPSSDRMRSGALDEAEGYEVEDLVRILWQRRWVFIAITTAFVIAGLAYAFLATPWYRAETVLAPATNKPADGLASQVGNLAGLASLAGINIGGSGNSSEPIAVLRSNDFARDFIESQNLLPILFSDEWDARAGRWKSKDEKKWPDWRDGVKFLNEKVRTIQEDKKTGLVTMSIEWTDPNLAASWANTMVERANDRLRNRALTEAEANVNYLSHELASTNVVTLQQSIGRLLDGELQTVMLARGKKEFAFRVIDRGEVPKWRSRPRRIQIVAISGILGAAFSIFVIFVLNAWRRRHASLCGVR